MRSDSGLKSPIQLNPNYLLQKHVFYLNFYNRHHHLYRFRICGLFQMLLSKALQSNIVLYNVDIEGGAGYQEEAGNGEE